MAKKVSGLNMLVLGGLLLLFLFFWGAYKVKDGFAEKGGCDSTLTAHLSSRLLYGNKEDSLTEIKNTCLNQGIIQGPDNKGCYYSNWRVSNCNSKEDPSGKWKSRCTCTGNLIQNNQ